MKRFLTAAACCVLLLLVVALGFVAYNLGDAEPRVFPDLNPVRVEVAAERDGYPLLEEATREWTAAGFDGRVRDMSLNENWDPDLLGAALERNTEAIDLFVEAAGKEALDLPVVEWWDIRQALSEYRALTRATALRGQLRIFHGEVESGLDDLFACARIGRMLAEGNHGPIDYLTGTAIHGIAIDRGLRAAIPHLPMTADLAKEIVERLERVRIPSRATANMFRWEHERHTEMIHDITRSGSGTSPGLPAWMSSMTYFYKPNRTAADSAERFHLYVGLSLRDVFPADEIPSERELSMLNLFPYVNVVGELLNEILVPTLDRLLEMSFKHQATQSVLQTTVAAAAFERDNERLPAALEELVPNYLPTVPSDPFTGEPLRYSESDRIVYSVGADNHEDPKELADDQPFLVGEIPTAVTDGSESQER